METKKINWANDFKINESLHSMAQEISAAYGRMWFNNQNHVESGQWKEMSLKWSDYDRKIKDFVFDSEQIAEKEINKLSTQCRDILALEKSLPNKGTG